MCRGPYGECVDIHAPGVDVVSPAPGGGEATMSGTSMVSPHLAGVARCRSARSPNLLLNTQFLQG